MNAIYCNELMTLHAVLLCFHDKNGLFILNIGHKYENIRK